MVLGHVVVLVGGRGDDGVIVGDGVVVAVVIVADGGVVAVVAMND